MPRFEDDENDDFQRDRRSRSRDFSQELAPAAAPPASASMMASRDLPYNNPPQQPNNAGNYGARRPQRFSPAEPAITGEPEEVTVKWFNNEKAFGFVRDKNGQDLFIHMSVLRNAGMETLTDGQVLTIRRGPGRKPNTEAANMIVVD